MFVCSELDCIVHNEKLIIIKEGKTPILSSAKRSIYFTRSHLGSLTLQLLSLQMKSYGEAIQMNPLQQYFHMVLFI